jgi:hypothetical protein
VRARTDRRHTVSFSLFKVPDCASHTLQYFPAHEVNSVGGCQLDFTMALSLRERQIGETDHSSILESIANILQLLSSDCCS